MENSTLIILGSIMAMMVTGGIVLVFNYFNHLRKSSRERKNVDLELTVYKAELSTIHELLENHRRELYNIDYFLHKEIGSGMSVIKLNVNELPNTDPEKLNILNNQLDSTLKGVREHSRTLSRIINSGHVLDLKLKNLVQLISPQIHFEIEIESSGISDFPDTRFSELAYDIIRELILRAAGQEEVSHMTIIANNIPYDNFNLMIDIKGKVQWDNILFSSWLKTLQTRLDESKGEVILHTSNKRNAEVIITFPYTQQIKPT